MRITFIGADHEVTGSCHYLETGNKKLLVDCGLEQGGNSYQNRDLPVKAFDIDYVLLTHAHIDHSGLLPLLYARGFRGNVFATPATCDLCDIMLRDSAHIQQFEAEWQNRKAKRAGKPPVEPLYEMEDAEGVLGLFLACEYDDITVITEDISVRFRDVGHLLGSACIEVWLKEGDASKKIVFSGDVGNKNKPIVRDPQPIGDADYVVLESTYGDRSHKEAPNYVEELAKIIKETFDRSGNVVIPAFAVGRTQEILYYLRKIKTDRLVKGHENFEVYVDSPLAIEATNIFNKNVEDCFDEEAMELIHQGINPITFPGLKLSITSEESKEINFNTASKVIISASGMCEAGRIRHHLKHNLWRKECTIIFVGYQAAGTLGRSLMDGAAAIKLFGESIDVRASIVKLDGVSGHADKNGLIDWLKAFKPNPKQVFLVHGEDRVCEEFAECLNQEYGYNAKAPFSGSVYDLASGTWVEETEGILTNPAAAPAKKTLGVFARLVAAGERLMKVIGRNEGVSNKDLAKFADQINSLCDKWDR